MVFPLNIKMILLNLVLLISVHVLGVRELDVSEGPGLDAVPVGGVLKGEGSADDFQGRVGTVNSSTFNAFDFQSKK